MRAGIVSRLFGAAAVIAAIALAGCGGGGGSVGPSPSPTPTPSPSSLILSGTAATGAAVANAAVRVIDRTGAVRNGTSGADGRYTITITGLQPPLALVVEGRIGESVGQLYSVLADAPASGTVTLNATPLTSAVAALITGPDLNALTQPSSLAAVTIAQVNAIVTALRTALAPALTAAGVTNVGTFDPLSTAFAVGTAGYDRVLDIVRVSVGAQGVTFVNAAEPVGDNGPTGAASITLSASNLASPPVISASAPLPSDLLSQMQAGFNACFAQPAAARATASACTALFDSTYQHHGLTAAQRWLGNDTTMDNASFAVPQLLYTVVPSDAIPRPVLRFVWTRSDGEFGTRVDVARNFGTAQAPQWRLEGNKRPIELFIEPRFQRVVEVNSAGAGVSRYELGLRLIVSIVGAGGDSIARALVKGPGLPAGGVLLVRSSSCGTDTTLSIVNDTGVLGPVNAPIVFTTNASNFYRLAYGNVGSAQFTWPGGSRNYRDTPLDDPGLAAIGMGSLYSFEVWFRDPVTKVMAASPTQFFTRLASPLVSPSLGPSQKWNTVSDGTLTALLSGAAPALTSSTIDYARTAGAEPVNLVYLFGSRPDPQFNPPTLTDTTNPLFGALERVQSDQVRRPTDTQATLTQSTESRGYDLTIPGVSFPACSTVQVPALSDTGAYREIGLRSLTVDGVVKISAYAYTK